MKKIAFIMLTILLAVCISQIVSSCVDDVVTHSTKDNKEEWLEKSEEFAKVHNEWLDKFFNYSVRSSRSGNNSDSTHLRIQVRNMTMSIITSEYPSLQVTTTDSISDFLDEMLTKSIQTISDTIPVTVAPYISSALINFENGLPSQIIRTQVLNANMDPIQTQGVLTFISTLYSSEEYWISNATEWIKDLSLGKENYDFKDADLKSIAIADAWYGYYWTVFSGFNYLLGGGAAAAGSFMTYLNQL